MKLIGKGQFSKAYRLQSGKVLLKSRDNVKECMSLGWFPDHKMFPKIKRVYDENIPLEDDEQIYEMDFYERPKSLKESLSPRQWEFYRELRKLCVRWVGNEMRYVLWRKAFETLPNEFSNEKKALIEAIEALTNYGYDIAFEISPRNVAVKGKRLILLDCFFFPQF